MSDTIPFSSLPTRTVFSPGKMQLQPAGVRFHRTSTFQLPKARCNLFPSTTSSIELSTSNQMFILGMGFVGQFFAADLKTKGWAVSGTCTSLIKKNELEESRYQAYVFDSKAPDFEILEIVKNHTHLLVSVPPLGDPMLHHKKMVQNILKVGRLQWLGYLSSTGVYGDCGGAWVDEEYPAKPASELGQARLAAEEEWISLGHYLEIPSHVFRPGGIYGPGRSAVDTILKNQQPLSKGQMKRASKTYTSRVHIADLCRALHASISKPSPGRIYNIVDDDPAPRSEVFEFAQKLVDEKYPNFAQTIPCERTEKSIDPVPKEEKRVSNARMKKELGVKLIHPTYRSGLRSIIERMNNSSSTPGN